MTCTLAYRIDVVYNDSERSLGKGRLFGLSLQVSHSSSIYSKLSHWGIPVGLVLLALAVRLPALGQFLTPDEFLWVDRSRNFLAGMLNPAYVCESPANHTGFEQAVGLACTLRTGHPGVTTMWIGSLGITLRYLADGAPGPLFDYVLAVQTNPLDPRFIVPTRLPTVVLTSLWVAAMYWLVWRLLGDWRVAGISGLLLALDPFHAAFSRVIHHDALSTTFMTLSLLTALIYWGRRESRRWLVASGLLGGLAFLSKSPTFFLCPFVALIGLWSLADRRVRGEELSWRRMAVTVGDGLLWFACAVVVFVALWPAMWIIPGDVLRTVFFIGSKYASEGHAKGNFFLGTISRDPGLLFYPVTWLLRSSPLVWLGLIAAGIFGIRQWRSQGKRAEGKLLGLYLGWLVLFALLFVIFMTLGDKKQDRYILPVYPVLSIIAAVGLVQISNIKYQISNIKILILVMVILLVQGGLVVASFPYYLTYYNPLLGGIRSAQRMVTIGWGEGLDLAAAYLNQKPDAERLQVASWYQSTFAPFFDGEAISYSKEKGKAMAGDYVIFYINQLQRRFPDDELFRYFETRYQPETVISLKGIDYAMIYPAPRIQHYVEDKEGVEESRRKYTGIAALLGWDWPDAADPNHPVVEAGESLAFRVYWEYLGKNPEDQFFFRLLGPDEQVWAEGIGRPVWEENGDPAGWREGQIITEEGELVVPAGTPPGEYQVQIGFYTQAPAVQKGELIFDLPLEESWVEVKPPTQRISAADLGLSRQLDASLGELRLLGTTSLDAPLTPDEPWMVDVYWQAEAIPSTDYGARLSLVDADGQTRWVWDAGPLVTFYPTSEWEVGEAVRSQMTIIPTRRTPGGEFDLVLTLLDSEGRSVDRAILGGVRVEGRVRSFSVPTVEVPVEAVFGDAIELVGFNPQSLNSNLHLGDDVALTLVWRALAPVDEDYTVTVQLVGPDGEVYGQRDAQPLDGVAPTSAWSPNEVLTDTYRFAVAADAPPGDYQLIVAIYLPETGERLAVEGDGNTVTLASVVILD